MIFCNNTQCQNCRVNNPHNDLVCALDHGSFYARGKVVYGENVICANFQVRTSTESVPDRFPHKGKDGLYPGQKKPQPNL